jgi:hypothetical protein
MGVRNCSEMGENLRLIISRLLANDNLVNLLYYTDKDPLSNTILTQEQKKSLVFEKLIKIIPRVGPKDTAQSIVSLRVIRGTKDLKNIEFKNIKIGIEIFVPLTQWFIKDENLRPFLIMGEIEKSLNGKTINGLGKLNGGDFELNFLTEEISCYEMTFELTTYD